MALKMVQFRYYGEKNPIQDNFPPISIIEDQSNRKVLWPKPYTFEKYKGIQKIIFQTIPGIRIYINRALWNNGQPFIIGKTGVLEINVRQNLTKEEQANVLFDNSIKITGLELDEDSKTTINTLEDGYLIITIVYTGEEGEEVI